MLVLIYEQQLQPLLRQFIAEQAKLLTEEYQSSVGAGELTPTMKKCMTEFIKKFGSDGFAIRKSTYNPFNKSKEVHALDANGFALPFPVALGPATSMFGDSDIGMVWPWPVQQLPEWIGVDFNYGERIDDEGVLAPLQYEEQIVNGPHNELMFVDPYTALKSYRQHLHRYDYGYLIKPYDCLTAVNISNTVEEFAEIVKRLGFELKTS